MNPLMRSGGFGAIRFDKGFQRIAKLGGCVAQRHVVIQPELKRLAVGVTHLDFINVFGPRAFVGVEKTSSSACRESTSSHAFPQGLLGRGSFDVEVGVMRISPKRGVIGRHDGNPF
jgi:hypothetical protein